jgi:plastocyanin
MIRGPRRTFVLGLVAASLLVSGAACSSSSSNNPAPTTGPSATATASSVGPASPSGSASPSRSATNASSATVQIQNFAFTPQNVTIHVGGTVTWKFDDSAEHTVTAVDRSFNSQPMSSGQTFQHTFTKAGTYNYFCSIHQFMTGTIVVQ